MGYSIQPLSKGIATACLYLSMGAMAAILTHCVPVKETANPLEQRLDKMLSEMTTQEKIEQLYYLTDGNERLGIPQFKGSDGPHGIGNGAKGFSSFPVPIGMAATWDPALISQVGRAISLEQASRGKDRIAGPTLDLLIDPRMGRAPETMGEDPFLAGRIGEAFVLGQNTTSVFGSVKHYNLNTYEINRRTNNYLSDKRSLVEFWGYHWKRTVQQGGAFSIMCAYNWVNGDKCAENEFLIQTLLREHWGFDFYTMSDWGGFTETKKALDAELDFCEGNNLYIKELPEGVANGLIDTALIDRAAKNLLRTKLLSGMIDGVPTISEKVIDSPEHRELVYQSGLQGLVLLKNTSAILPLNKNEIGTLAVIGPNAAVLPLDGNSSSKVVPSYTIPVLQAMKAAIGEEKVVYAKGCNMNDTDSSQFRAALDAARNADYVLFVGGLDQTVEGEGYFLDKEADEKGGGAVTRPDRPSGTVGLPGMQNTLINALAAVNPNLILVVISGGPCSVTPVINQVKGLLYAFYPGQEAGRAITDVVLGAYNPSGKLPATIPKNDEQIIPISADFTQMVSKGAGYRWFDSQQLSPEFAFGFGQSYTTFQYSNLRLSAPVVRAGEKVEIYFDLKNTGTRAGEEVAQLYLSAESISPLFVMPEKQLRGFSKVLLAPGETQTITLSLSAEEFYVYEETTASYHVPEGQYTLRVGGASDNLPLAASLRLEKAKGRPDLTLVNIRSLPAFPKAGEPVVFIASLINNGTAPIQPGETIKVSFMVDGKPVARYVSTSTTIPAGGMHMACAEGLNGVNWLAQNGEYHISAEVEIASGKEISTENNACHAVLTVPDGKILPAEIASQIK